MTQEEELAGFIQSAFPSIWSLELLLLLKRERRHWNSEELVSTLRASNLVVAKALASLVAAGLAGQEDEGALYMPVSNEVAVLVDKTESLYASKPDAVRRMIIRSSSASSGLSAFADAFRFWNR